MPERHVLLVAYGGGHVTMIAPVARELERRGVRCTVMALTTGYLKAQKLGLKPVGYRDFADLAGDRALVRHWGETLAAGNSHPDVDPLESVLYLGTNYCEWIAEHGEDGAARLYAERGRFGFLPRRFMERVIARLRPDAVVTTNSPRTEQAAIEAAVALGVPVLSMIDLFALPYDGYAPRPVHADRIAVISAFAKSNLVGAGIAPERVVVTGNPAFDSLADPAVRVAADAFLRGKGWEGHKVVFLAPQIETDPATPPQWVGNGVGVVSEQALRGWLAGAEDRALIVRHHPSEGHQFPDLGAHPRVHRSDPLREALHPLLKASSLAVVQTSTVGLEAVLSGVPLLSLSFSPSVTPERWDYVALGLADAVWSPEELPAAVDAALAGPARAAGLDFNVGRAAAAVAAEVVALTGKGSDLG